ncbi:MAG: lysophospholipid acyltransferase family protein [Pseudomonadota bacterium]
MMDMTDATLDDAPLTPAEAAAAFSYATYFDHPVKRSIVRVLETISGQPKMKKLYLRYREELSHRETFWDAAVRLLKLDVRYDAARFDKIPADGPLVIVANHPFGVLDGVMICWLIGLKRKDFKILTNSVLNQAPEVQPHILPIDFAETPVAVRTNLKTRADALAHLKDGGCIIVFPAGGISTAPTAFSRAAIDDVWKPFTAKLITQSGASVTPVFFEGQNSRLFQWASHVSPVLRLSLVFREVKRRMGDRLNVHIGETMTPEDLKSAGKRDQMMKFLRECTYGLAPPKLQRRIARAETRSAKKAEKADRPD